MAKRAGRILVLLTAIAVLVGCDGGGGKSPSPANSPPVAAFTVVPSSGHAPLTVQLDASTSSDPDGSIVSYVWILGDNSPAASGVSVSHVYSSPGTFTATLTVADSRGAVATTTRNVYVSNPLVPDVVGLTESAARSAIAAAGLSIVSVSSASSASVPQGSVISQAPIAGSVVSPGSTVSLVLSSGPSGQSSIGATLQVPKVGQLVPDTVSIIVSVTSTYEVSAVTASMAGSQTVLAYDPDGWDPTGVGPEPAYVGALSLAGQAPGTYTLEIRAEDVRGNVALISAQFVHDSPPLLEVAEPLDRSVALPTVPLDARCSDDHPGCVVQVFIGEQPYQSAPSALSGLIDLSSYIGTGISLRFESLDSSGQVTVENRVVYVENPARLTVVAEVPGLILDADEQRLLFVERAELGDALAIYDRVTGITENIPLPANQAVRMESAYLTGSGAIFEAQPQDGSTNDARIYHWRGTSLTDLGPTKQYGSLAVSGSYAIWNDGSDLYLLDTTTGVPSLVSSEAGNIGNSVADDGTVVFWTAGTGTPNIVRDRQGVQSTLTSDASHSHRYPLTDGTDVVYQQSDPRYAIVLLKGATPVQLSAERDVHASPGDDYRIDGGWVAYTDLGVQQQLHVFTRSPQGSVTRHTDFSEGSRIDRLADNGEVMLKSGNQLFFSRGNGAVAVSSVAGNSYWLSGAWYVAIGRAFLSVDTRE